MMITTQKLNSYEIKLLLHFLKRVDDETFEELHEDNFSVEHFGSVANPKFINTIEKEDYFLVDFSEIYDFVLVFPKELKLRRREDLKNLQDVLELAALENPDFEIFKAMDLPHYTGQNNFYDPEFSSVGFSSSEENFWG